MWWLRHMGMEYLECLRINITEKREENTQHFFIGDYSDDLKTENSLEKCSRLYCGTAAWSSTRRMSLDCLHFDLVIVFHHTSWLRKHKGDRKTISQIFYVIRFANKRSLSRANCFSFQRMSAAFSHFTRSSFNCFFSFFSFAHRVALTRVNCQSTQSISQERSHHAQIMQFDKMKNEKISWSLKLHTLDWLRNACRVQWRRMWNQSSFECSTPNFLLSSFTDQSHTLWFISTLHRTFML